MVYGIALRYVLQIYGPVKAVFGFVARAAPARGRRGAYAGSKDGGAQRAVPVGSADGGRPFMRVVRAPTLAMTLATSIIIHRGTDRTTGSRRAISGVRFSPAGAPGVFRTHAPGGPQKHARLSLVSYRYSVRT